MFDTIPSKDRIPLVNSTSMPTGISNVANPLFLLTDKSMLSFEKMSFKSLKLYKPFSRASFCFYGNILFTYDIVPTYPVINRF